jgi:hypothetical protein
MSGALEAAAEALNKADGSEMSGDYAYELAQACVSAYLGALVEQLPEEMIAAAATALRNGQPHDGSDLDYAVDDDARAALKAGLEELRK